MACNLGLKSQAVSCAGDGESEERDTSEARRQFESSHHPRPFEHRVVQSSNSPFLALHIGLNPGGRREESRITSMRMLRTNQSKITRPLSIRLHTCSRQRVAQYLFQLALCKKNFSGVDIVVKNKLISVLSWSVPTTTTCHYSFPKHFFVLFLHF